MAIMQLQPAGGWSMDASENNTATAVYLGDLVSIKAFAATLTKGSLISGYGYVVSWTLEQGLGASGRLTVTCANQSAEDHAGNEPLSDAWCCSTSRIDLPVERYCGISEGASAWLDDIQHWRQEPESDLYRAYKYRDSSGAEITISAQSQLLAAKIRAGKEFVMRHYPTITRKRVYASMPDCLTNIDQINTPGSDFDSKAAAWLKVQDDVDQQSNGTWLRSESWIGADSWDTNFYGTGSAAFSGSGRWPLGGDQ